MSPRQVLLARVDLLAILLIALSLLEACQPSPAPSTLSAAAQGAAGGPLPANLDVAWSGARDVLERRCVVCHGCYDAPCQLQLGSFEGIDRGASKQKVYEPDRLRASAPTRLFVDAHSTPAWRDRDFFPVLPPSTAEAHKSLLVRMLSLKREHPLPNQPFITDSS